MPVPWHPNHPAVFVEPPTGLPVSLVRHDGYPYEEVWDEAGTGWSGLFQIANRYLRLANTRLQLPPEWLEDLLDEPAISTLPGTALHWLRDSTDPRHSYWVTRQAGLDAPNRPKTGTVLDRTAVLLAGLWFSAPTMSSPTPLFGGQGLRILVQTGPPATSNLIRITSVASTLPQAPVERMSVAMLEHTAERIARTFGLPEEVEVVDVGVRLPSEHEKQSPLLFAKTAMLPGYDDDDHQYEMTSYLLVMRANDKFPDGLEPLARRPLIASADADLFVQDPVSRNGAKHFTRLRPSRSWLVLDPERVNTPLGNLPAGSGGKVQLVDPDPNTPPDPDFWVTDSRLVDPPLAESATKEVAPSVHDHVRTHTFAAVNAFYHTSDLFQRMRQYGLSPADYFKFVERPIDVRYRAGIVPGFGDGRTVNAQVRWTLRPDSDGRPSKGTIEVRFALGDLESAVGRLPANMPSAVEKSPLGAASDPRWCWHEYSHVLITAAVGDLELRFAHSAGDALAAILSDPGSQLANDQNGTLANDGPWRGVTFPWVLIPRRHDREARDGWSWTGSLYQREVYFAVAGLSDKRGYWAEQILSSSLFRLYRAIGGDAQAMSGGKPVPAASARQKAADYCAYLIMRTIQSLGSAGVTPSTSPGQFAELMRTVDTATATAAGPGGYVGGTVQKVVRWAFERQGLSSMPSPSPTVSGPDESGTVDLHIEDLRPKPDGPYSPVDLLGPAWRADPQFLSVKKSWFSAKRKIRVKVQNRGVAAATNTRVDVWYAPVMTGVIPDFPDSTRWTLVESVTGGTVPGRKGSTPGTTTFGPFSWTPPAAPQEYAILAAASCDADLSNIDPATKQPCATIASPVNILVGCDNNLGLVTVTIS
jgi:hypothetical protein